MQTPPASGHRNRPAFCGCCGQPATSPRGASCDRCRERDRHYRRRYRAKVRRPWRTYLRLAYLWDDAKGRNKGKRIYATRPEVERRGDGAIVGADGEPLRKRHGALVTNWNDHRAVRTGRQERNPVANLVPELGPEDLIRLAYQDTIPADERQPEAQTTKCGHARPLRSSKMRVP